MQSVHLKDILMQLFLMCKIITPEFIFSCLKPLLESGIKSKNVKIGKMYQTTLHHYYFPYFNLILSLVVRDDMNNYISQYYSEASSGKFI